MPAKFVIVGIARMPAPLRYEGPPIAIALGMAGTDPRADLQKVMKELDDCLDESCMRADLSVAPDSVSESTRENAFELIPKNDRRMWHRRAVAGRRRVEGN